MPRGASARACSSRHGVRRWPRRGFPGLLHNRGLQRVPALNRPAPRDVNNLLILLGLETWKPLLTALVLPPVPLLLLVLIGARTILPRRGLGWLIIVVSVGLLWASACTGTARVLNTYVLHPPAALSAERIKELRDDAKGDPKGDAKSQTAIVILGGGLEPFAPEYGAGNLSHTSLERLRYGIWLSRQTGLPTAFSGGVGWAQPDATPEARIAANIAATEFSRPIKWVEDNARDTHENAGRSVALLRAAGIKHIVLVTHAVHMPRALHEFETAAGTSLRVEAAPMGLARDVELPSLRWVPSGLGAIQVREILRELVGRVFSA